MNRFCNIIMTISALALILSSIIVTLRGQRRFTGPNPKAMLLHKIYIGASSCSGTVDFSYKTPFGCYHPDTYNDGSTRYDVYDEILEWTRDGRPTSFRRTYYSSQDGSCQDQIDGIMMKSSLWSSLCTTSSNGDNDAMSEKETLIFTN